MTPPKLISVVIPAYNCEKTISQTLQGALNQDYQGAVEIVVVDDGSTDRTAAMVKAHKSIRYVYQKNAGPAAARNRGFYESKGEIVFFTDADCAPENNWMSKALSHFDDSSVGVVSGSYGIANENNILARAIHKEIIFRHKCHMPVFPKSFGSYNFCIRRDAFEKAKGFNESYPFASGEDNDLSYKILKLGYKIYFEKDCRVKHYHPESWSKYLCEQGRHGFWRVKIYAEHPKMAVGDDYTFWKDIVEPAAVIGFVLGSGAGAFHEGFLAPALSIFASLAVIEFFYAWIITRNGFEAIYYGFVMLSRAFARTFGFLLGILLFSLRIYPKKN